jgi:glycosyltransferase involved in cell wall biosynthesis
MISVVIPTLNEEKLLGQMLQQFGHDLRQRFDLEVIVSDGGSRDRTIAIAREHKVQVIENTDGHKQTISEGRNCGAERARGDILVFLNADTLVRNVERFFTRIIAELSDDRIVAVTCSVEVYPEEARWADRIYHGFYNWLFSIMNDVGMGMGRGECHVIRRTVFDRVGGYATKIAAGEDYDMFRRLRSMGTIRFLQDIMVFESPRRYRKYGYLYVSASWFVNFLSVFFLRRSILSEWKPIR